MPENFSCPFCNARFVILEGASSFQKCESCGGQIIVPTKPRLQMQTPNFQTDRTTASEQKLEEIRYLAENGDLIVAIKTYRETFGVGLKQAKAAVEQLAGGRSINPDGFGNVQSTAPNLNEIVNQSLKFAEIYREIQAGRKINAIKMFREIYQCDLKTAKDAIEAIERGDKTEMAKMTIDTRDFNEEQDKDKSDKLTLGGFILWLLAAVVVAVIALCLFVLLSR